MNALPDDTIFETARRTLALLHVEADAVRKELAGLRRNLVQIRQEFDDTRAMQLLEANEQLLGAALRAREISDSAFADLEALSRASQFDELTRTATRALTIDRIDNAIAQARRHGTRVALLFLDVDGFKAINDTRGHAAGDDALRRVASRLTTSVRESDAVGRFGGDEFLVLLAEVAGEADVATVADKMLAALARPDADPEPAAPLSVSIGIALYPDDGADSAALIALADACMYRSKRRGGASYTFHSGRVAQQPPVDAAPRPGAGPQAPSASRTATSNRQCGIADAVAWARALNARQLEFMALRAY